MRAIEFHWKIMDTMCRFKQRTETVLQPFCTENEITPLQLHILIVLYFEGAQTVTALAKRTCTAGANNSTLCKRLAGQGLLSRHRDEIDERQVLIELLPKGKRLVEDFAQHSKAEYKIITAQFSEVDLEAMLGGFTQILAVIEKNNNEEIE